MALSLLRYTWADPDSEFCRILKERTRRRRERSLAIPIKNGDAFPENVIVEILSWLPVKDLLQLKTVSKTWYAIISSPGFISKHLKNYYNNNNDWRGCLLAEYYVSHAELQLFELLVDDEPPKVLANEVLYSMPMYGSYIYGPCDGIYYLYNYDNSKRALWNPATNEHKVLPPIVTKPDLSPNLTYAKHEAYGFGHDPVTEDYKVVVIKGYWTTTDEDTGARNPLSVLVYSLRTDSWRYWGDLAHEYELSENKCYISVNGCFYWLGSCDRNENPEVIISFNMGTDECQEIQKPDYEQPASKCLGVYQEALAFLAVHETEKRIDVWTLNEGLWTKKDALGPFPELRRPLGHWKENRLLLEGDDGKLVMWDPEKREMRDLGFQMGRWCEGVFTYMESLVSIKDLSTSRDNEEDEDD